MMPLTPWVRRLLIANVVLFLATNASPALTNLLVLRPALPWVMMRPWTLVTYMFLHAGIGHIFFNMLALYFFGPRLESRLGSGAFLWLYFLSGIGGAVGSMVFAPQFPVVGASGAVYGVLVGFAMYWPNERLFVFPIPVPMPAWILATIMVLASLWMGFSGSGSGVAHFAHLGGLACGFIFLKALEWRRGAPRRAFQQAMAPQSSNGVSDRVATARWKGISTAGLHEINREEVERLLAKVADGGSRSLTPAEREFLDRMASR